MTTAEQFREVVSRPGTTVSIAGVPWPAFKVVALLLGAVVFVIVGVMSSAVAPAVLTATAVTVVAWLILGATARLR